MKNVYMVQPNSQYGNSIYFPYAAGSLIAYSFNDADVAKEYEFKGFVYKKGNISDIVSKLDTPFLVGFSCYIWNFEFNKKLAKAIKAVYPECKIVFGGHQISQDSELVSEKYVDYIILGEGEDSFKKLLLSLINKEKIETVNNLIYFENGIIRHTSDSNVVIPERVSAYTEGYFNDIIKDEELSFSAILETNRGCPNKCAFCDWGNVKSRIKLYDIETVKKEIDWMSENKIEYCYCADSNFGMFERDLSIVDYLIKKHNQTGYPQKFQATYSKSNPETVFEITKKLNESGMSKGATLSFQSMHQNVLDNIYRRNMPIEYFKELMTLYNKSGISAYSELIIGLPGETYESFKDGIEQLLEAGQHMSINFFNCELLVNSIMNDPEYIKKHSIRFAYTQLHQYHIVPDENTVPEISRIVVATSDLSETMWMDCNILAVFIRAMHNLGALQCVAIYLFFEKHIEYTEFYCKLIEWAKANPSTVCGRIYYWLLNIYKEVLQNSGSLTCVEPEFGNITWPLDEGAFLKIIKDFDLFFSEIYGFIKPYFDDDTVYNELMEYQISVIKSPYLRQKKLNLTLDWYGFFKSIYSNNYKPLSRKENVILIDAYDVPSDFEEYARKVIWFGRKGGQNIITNIMYIQ